MHPEKAYGLCMRHMNRYVRVTTKDGKVYDGFIAEVNPGHVILAVPSCEGDGEFGGESSSGSYFRDVVFFGRRRRRFFRRVILPFFIISSLFLRPFWW